MVYTVGTYNTVYGMVGKRVSKKILRIRLANNNIYNIVVETSKNLSTWWGGSFGNFFPL